VLARTRTRPVALPRLNDLSGTEWVRFTKSWFVANPPRRSSSERSHPAKFPEELCEGFVRFFTRKGMWVLDPFAGTGSTLVAALRQHRRAVGLEINPGFARLAEERIRGAPQGTHAGSRVLVADARDLADVWCRERLPLVQLVLTSPPYWDMLGKSRGGSRSAHRDRAADGLATTYSRDPRDLGNLHDYAAFLDTTVEILRSAASVLEVGRYLVVVAQNLRDVDGRLRTLAWDLARELDRPPFQFQGERIWCQDSKPLGIWGFPSTFVPNYHHHYCLIFRRTGASESGD
jgi:DNA methylase